MYLDARSFEDIIPAKLSLMKLPGGESHLIGWVGGSSGWERSKVALMSKNNVGSVAVCIIRPSYVSS